MLKFVVTPKLAALGRFGDTGSPYSFRHQTNPMLTPALPQCLEAEPRYISIYVSSVVRSPCTEAARVEQSQLNFPAPLCIIYQGWAEDNSYPLIRRWRVRWPEFPSDLNQGENVKDICTLAPFTLVPCWKILQSYTVKRKENFPQI